MVGMKKKKKNNIFANLKQLFKNIGNGFKNLNKTTKSLIVLWTCIILILIVVILISNVNNKHLSNYTNLEQDLKKAALKYAEEKELLGTNSQKVRLDLEGLVDDGYLKITEEDNDSCIGYALVYSDDEGNLKAKPYLSCKGYTTDGFVIG